MILFLRKLVQVIDPGGNTPGSDEERIEQDDLTDFVPPTPHDSPLSGGHTPGSDEGRPNINELMAICTNLSNRVLALEQSKTAQDLVIRKLKKKVKKLEKKLRARTIVMKLFKIGTSRRKSLDKRIMLKVMLKLKRGILLNMGDTVNTASIDVSVVGPSNVSADDPSTSTARDIFEDEMVTITDTLVAIRSTRPRTTSVVIHDVEEEPRRATSVPTVQGQDKGKGKMVEPEPTPKNPIKTQIQRDAEIAQRLFEEEQAQFEREQRISREKAAEQKANDAVLIEQIEDIQSRIDADELLAERLQQEEREQFTIEEKSRLLVEMIAERKRFFAHQRAEQIRNKPTNQKDVLKGSRSGSNDFVLWIMEVVKTIESADGSSKNYKIFSEMLDDFDGQYVLDLYRLVKEIFETASPEGYDRLRWGDLITVFESSEDDVDLEANRTTH
ncbi:hypothetical protein Tco_0475859 [Tanacetum coccineum]